MKPREEPCREAPGLGGEGKPLSHSSEEDPQLQVAPRRETPLHPAVSGVRQFSEAPGEAAGTGGESSPSLGEPPPERRLALRRPQPPAKSCPVPVPGPEVTPGRRLNSPASGRQKKTSSAASPGGPRPARDTPSHASCGPSLGSCHLAKLLSSLDQKNHKHLEPRKRPLEVSCPIRKKTRTLYRSDQLEELERLFQEDHYPDSDKRREISQAVGVTPQRIMVWFQNRRAKWRKGEKLNGAEHKDSPAEAGPGPGGSQPSCAAELPAAVPVDPEPRPFPQEQPLDVLPEPPLLLTSDQMLAPAQQSKGVPGAVVNSPLFSPPPVRRAKLPLPPGPLSSPPAMSVLLDTPGIDSAHKDSAGGSWEPSFAPPLTCSYLEALEPHDYQAGNQLEPFQLPPAPQPQLFPPLQPQLSYLHSFPLSATLVPPLPEEPLFTAPYGSGSAQGYFPAPQTGQLLLPPLAGNPGGVPWSDPCLPDLPLPSAFCPPALGPPLGDSCLQELLQAPYAPDPSKQPCTGLVPPPEGARAGSGPLLGKDPEWPGPVQEQPQALDDILEEDKSSFGS